MLVVAIAATGLLAVTTVAAQAHQGSIRVTRAVCVDADTIEATYTWTWSGVPRASYGTRVVRKTGTTSFEGSWGGRGGSPLTTVDTSSGGARWTVRLSRSQFSGGNGPWEYVYAPWSDGYTAGRYNDTRVEGVDWNRCAPAAAKDASAVVSTTPPTCDSAEQLVLGRLVNATWGTPSRTTGPGAYTVTATATDGHLFADGSRSRTFTGTLGGRRTGQTCAGPAPAAEHQVRNVSQAPDCATRTTTSWSEERSRGSVWSDADNRYLPGSWTAWTEVPGSKKSVAATPQQCPRPPSAPVRVRGAVKKLAKCGRNDFLYLKPVVGGVYRINGKPVKQGTWIKERKQVVRITFDATGSAYRVVGKRVFTVRYPKTGACGAPPSKSPHTGLRAIG